MPANLSPRATVQQRAEMQVEFFEGSNPRFLQDKINAWLKEHANIATHLIVQTQEPGTKAKPGSILVSLWYSERPALPPGLDAAIIHGHGVPRGFRLGKV
jgi:hypothetical protein